ncbi:nucleoside-diphosphate kinase [Nocardia arizonensis]|uniref:nucleoside-diphosphate kinase n=1 Tax=Nocardia arizonensis TaxID=1141647 RepID=UPI0006D06276|nr:nucleoside-diphosphate kinase [Nocardia arizonensis]
MSEDDPRALLRTLTPTPAKVEAYLGDTYLLETVEHLRRRDIDPAAFARGHSLLLLKPDAIVARAVEPTLRWLDANGFRLLGAYRVPVDRHLARALWYFAWNIASPERRRLADLLVGISDALVLLVRGEDADLPVPVRLAEAKGPTDPHKRRPGELRHTLGLHSYLLNLVHSPDDPADVLREFAIYFDERAREAVLADLDADTAAGERAERLARDLYRGVPAGSFDRADALTRLRADVGDDTDGAWSDADCARLLYSAWADGRDLDPWSVIVLGSHVLPMRAGTRSQTLRPVTADDWLGAQP